MNMKYTTVILQANKKNDFEQIQLQTDQQQQCVQAQMTAIAQVINQCTACYYVRGTSHLACAGMLAQCTLTLGCLHMKTFCLGIFRHALTFC